MSAPPPPTYATKPLDTWGSSGDSVRVELLRAIRGLRQIILYTITPRVARPQSPLDPPDPVGSLTEETLAQCKTIYDEVEAVRQHLDEKARSTFAVIAFLAPLLVAVFVFLFAHLKGGGVLEPLAIALALAAFSLLTLGFIGTARALAIQSREVLFLESVIDPTVPSIRPYDRTRHAKGLLYCASMNASINAHIAQCVRSAHVLTTLAVIVAIGAAVPATWLLMKRDEPITKAEIVKPVTVTYATESSINESVQQLSATLSAMQVELDQAEQAHAMEARLKACEAQAAAKHVAQPQKPPIQPPSVKCQN
jgi:hypothetical protein